MRMHIKNLNLGIHKVVSALLFIVIIASLFSTSSAASSLCQIDKYTTITIPSYFNCTVENSIYNVKQLVVVFFPTKERIPESKHPSTLKDEGVVEPKKITLGNNVYWHGFAFDDGYAYDYYLINSPANTIEFFWQIPPQYYNDDDTLDTCIDIIFEFMGGVIIDNNTSTPTPTSDSELNVTEITIDGITYTLEGKSAIVTSAKSSLKSASIPDTISANNKTYKVSAIAENAFKGLKKLTSVSIGKNVSKIGDKAFSGCTKLKTVSGGTGVTSIGACAFEKCVALSSFTLQSKVKSIGEYAFNGCKKLVSIIIKTTKLTTSNIGDNAFTGTNAKATITCPTKKLKAYKTLLVEKGVGPKATFK